VLPKAASANAIPEKSAASAAAAAEAQERAAAEDAAVRAAAATAQASAAPAKTKTFGSSSGAETGTGGAPVTGNGTGSEPGVAGGTGTVTFRGSEMGNALTTTFGASSGQVGRNIYVPIYLYMPLPQIVPDSIYHNVAAKGTFRSYYRQSGSDWQLIAQPQVSQRGDIWTMLESAGFDASTADYRTGTKLSPVVLEFAVGPVSKSKVELVDVRLVSSSGSSEIDEAVMYGFRQASFFNKTGFAVGGKFVYGF
jgi:cytochrome c5